MNLGAGRIIYQDLAKVNLAVDSNSLQQEPVLKQAFDYANEYSKKVHFIGLVSNGGVHSHINHLKGLLTAAKHLFMLLLMAVMSIQNLVPVLS